MLPALCLLATDGFGASQHSIPITIARLNADNFNLPSANWPAAHLSVS